MMSSKDRGGAWTALGREISRIADLPSQSPFRHRRVTLFMTMDFAIGFRRSDATKQRDANVQDQSVNKRHRKVLLYDRRVSAPHPPRESESAANRHCDASISNTPAGPKTKSFPVTGDCPGPNRVFLDVPQVLPERIQRKPTLVDIPRG